MPTHSTIQLDRVSHHSGSGFEQIHLLDNFNLELNTDEITSIAGASGTCKSSLLAVAVGLEKPAQGPITYTVVGLPVAQVQFRIRSGLIFQHLHLLPEMGAVIDLGFLDRAEGAAPCLTRF